MSHLTIFVDLVAPIPLHEPRAVRGHARKERLSSKECGRPAPPNRVLALHAKLDVQDPKDEQCSHSIVQDLPIRTVELGDGCEGESQGHVLDEVGMRARFEKERVWVAVGSCALFESVAHVFLLLDATVDDAVREIDEVGGEWEGPGASNC